MAKAHTLETQRLILAEIEECDAQDIVILRSDEAAYRFFKYPHRVTIEEHLNWYYNSYLHDENRIDYLARDKQTRELVGIYGMKRINEEAAEVSYLTSPKHKRKGYGAEAVKSIMKECKEHWCISRAIAEINSANTASINFATHLGFVFYSENDGFIIMDRYID